MLNKIFVILANIIYSLFKILPTQNKLTMISRQSNKNTLDFNLIDEEIKKEKLGIKVKILCHKLDGGAKAKLSVKIRYIFHCFNQMYNIATSKVVLLDSYCILISILKHKKSLKVIQMWHSMGTMKKFGYQIIGLKEGSSAKLAEQMKMHKNYDFVFASSEAYAQNLADGFGCSVEKVRIYPLPRVDLLVSESYKNEIRKKIEGIYPNLMEKKNIVYCPTFRKNEEEMQKALEKLINSVNYEKYNLIIKLHPLSKITINNDRVIKDEMFSTFDMLFVADFVISDYSCVIYEAALLDIPLFFYAFDLPKYLENRGLAIDYQKELPGIISKDISEILKSIEDNTYNYEKLKEFKNKYIKKQKDCTKDIVNFVNELITGIQKETKSKELVKI